MAYTDSFIGDHDPRATVRGARVRRMLLEQVRFAITTEPAALGGQTDAGAHLESVSTEPPDLLSGSVTNIRGRVSITLGTIVVRLNQEGFDHSDRLYTMRDTLAEGRPIQQDDLEWLNSTIALERERAKNLGGSASR